MEIDLQLQLVALNLSVHKTKVLRDDLVEEQASQSRVDGSRLHGAVRHCL